MSYIESELSLVYLRMEHPDQFRQAEQQTFKSDLYIVPKSKGLGIVGLSEIVESLHLSQEIYNGEGKPANKKQIGDKFEIIFNATFGNISDKTSEIYKRKPFNRTKALDYLRNLIIRKDKEVRK